MQDNQPCHYGSYFEDSGIVRNGNGLGFSSSKGKIIILKHTKRPCIQLYASSFVTTICGSHMDVIHLHIGYL